MALDGGGLSEDASIGAAVRGPKPTPTALKLARGNPGKRALNANEPIPDELGIGEPPDDLSAEAVSEWNRLGPELENMGVLTHVDRHSFIAYCRNWARFLEADGKCKTLGEVVKAPSGYPIQNPYRSIANKAYQQCKDFWMEFGMTASARTRIEVKPRRGGKSAADKRKERFFGVVSRHA